VLALQAWPYSVLSRSQYRLIRSGDVREHWLSRANFPRVVVASRVARQTV
jgi:hypothetical protein